MGTGAKLVNNMGVVVRFLSIFLVAFGIIVGASTTQPAQAQRGGGEILRSVVVEGTRRIDPQTIGSYLRIKVGERFDKAKLDASLKALFETGFFRDVSMRREGGTLVIRVVENPIINRIAFEGNRKVSSSDLASEVTLKPRSVYSRTKIQGAVKRILAIYRAKGRFAATVNPKVISRSQNRVDLVFEIIEGKKTLVRRVSFIGNRVYSDGSLREAILTKETALWRIFGNSDIYDPQKLAADKQLLRRFYLQRGFADFRVLSAVAELSPDRSGFFVTITVSEGPRYRFGKVTVSTRLPRIRSSSLRSAVKIQKGQRYDAKRLQETVVSLADAAGRFGYAFVRVVPRATINRAKKTVDVLLVVQEGPRVFIERILIIGNTRTRDSVLRRQMLVAEGDAFNTNRIKLSERRLRNLNYFEKVKIGRRSGSAADKVVLLVQITEKATGSFSLGGGFSSQDGVLGTFSLREQNFLGRGYNIGLSFTISQRSSQLDLSFTDPHFLGRDIVAGIDLFRRTRRFQGNAFKSSSSKFLTEELGGRLRFGYRISEFLSQSWSYGFANKRITEVDDTASIFIKAEKGTTSTSSVAMTLTYDTRDDKNNPKDGYVVSVVTQFAGLGGSETFYKISGKAGYWYSVAPKWIVAFLGRAGHVNGIGQRARLQERFFVGGANFRGFEFGGIGPRDSATGDALGANNFWVATAELGFPLPLPKEFGLQGRIFTDIGTAFGIDVSGPTLVNIVTPRISVGAGLSWASPLGPLRVDIAFPIFKQSGDRTQFFHFRFGARF